MFNTYIINYNMNNHIETIYQNLLKSIDSKFVYILDNGSDKSNPHPATRIQLPVNVKLSGAFRHIWDNEVHLQSEYFVTITSSAVLLDIDYKQSVIQSVKKLQNKKWSAIYSKIENVDGWVGVAIPEQIGVNNFIKNPMFAQPIFTIWNTKYISELKRKKHGWYDIAYHHGQGATEDMRMYNLDTGWDEFTTPLLSIDWYRNNTFREGRGEHSQREYFKHNKQEFNARFKEKFNMTHYQVNDFLRKNRRK